MCMDVNYYQSIFQRIKEEQTPLYRSKIQLIVLIGGFGNSGKDKFIEYIAEKIPVGNESTIDPAKELLDHMIEVEKGYDIPMINQQSHILNKTAIYRETLHNIKMMWNRFDDGCDRITMKKVFDHTDKNIIFVHMREPECFQQWKEVCSLYCYTATLCIRGRHKKEEYTSHGDRDVEDYNHDIWVNNTGTLEELQDKANAFIEAFRNVFMKKESLQ